jgi:hypothetical protein
VLASAPSDDVRVLAMLVRIALWSLTDADATLDELRDALREDSHTLAGLLFEAWISDEAGERFGSISVWESADAAARLRELAVRERIGREPGVVEEFDLEATSAVAPQLARLGLAYEE